MALAWPRGRLRLAGAGLGSAVMLRAAATVIGQGEYLHAVSPLIVLVLTLLTGWRMVAVQRGRS